MKSLGLRDAIEFQEVFWHDGVYSPYESVEDAHTYFAAVIAGEVGTLLNDYSKQVRSPNKYQKEIEDDAADIFICLLIYGLLLQKKGNQDVLNDIELDWDTEPKRLTTEKEFVAEAFTLIQKVSCLASGEAKYLHPSYFLEIFEGIKAIGFYVTKRSWQETLDNFHVFTFEKMTDFGRYTPDLWYRGSCRVDFEKLIEWGAKNEVSIPPKRLLFLKRMSAIQKAQI
jgi:hypothetical protein